MEGKVADAADDPLAALEAANRVSFAARESKLKAQIAALTRRVEGLQASSSEGKRSQYIAALQSYLQERELVIDVLKAELSKASHEPLAAVEALVARKTLGGPKRMRPKSREELGVDIAGLESRLSGAMRGIGLLEGRLAREKARAEEAEGKAAQLAAGLAAAQASLEQQGKRYEGLLKEERDKARAAGERAEAAAKARLQDKADASSASALASQLQALASLEARTGELGQRYNTALGVIATLKGQLAEAEARRAGAEAALAQSKRESSILHGSLSSGLRAVQEAQEARRQAEEQNRQLRQQLQAAHAALVEATAQIQQQRQAGAGGGGSAPSSRRGSITTPTPAPARYTSPLPPAGTGAGGAAVDVTDRPGSSKGGGASGRR